MSKIIKLENEKITFDCGSTLVSSHDSDCCEHHELDPTGIELDEVKHMEFNLNQPLEELIERVEGYGIRLKSTNDHPLPIPGYGYNNGYYGSNIDLTLTVGDRSETIDISECQEDKY